MLDILPIDTATSIRDLNLKISPGNGKRNLPSSIESRLNDILLTGGKKVRPALCFLMGGVLGIPNEKMAPYARAAELTHLASIAHDDVIDESPKRRNVSSLNVATSNSEAVLTGDLLLARVMIEVSALGQVKVIHDLSSAVEDLVGGELLQLQKRRSIDVSHEHLEEVAEKKTGSLMGWCCLVGARLIGDDPRLVSACKKFGESLGVAFQMVDDILDFTPQGEKPYAQDLREGLMNFVAYEMVRDNPELKARIQPILGNLASEEAVTTWPWTDAQLEKARESVRMMARKKLLQARDLLTEIVEMNSGRTREKEPYLHALESVIGFLGERFV